MKNVLVVVDLQKDFRDPEGTLYVKGGELLASKLLLNLDKFDEVIFSLDWHPINHCSFKENGGIWPIHCVQYTEGAALPKELLQKSSNYSIILKGNNPSKEQYGIFEEYGRFQLNQADNYIVCGIAGDYCVLESLKQLLKIVPKEHIFVYIDAIASIDGGEKLNKFVKDNKLKIYKNDNY